MAALEAFFTHGEPRCCDELHGDSTPTAAGLPPSPSLALVGSNTSSVVYLHGPPHAGQTSLLLQYGFTQAKHGQSVVLVMCGGSGCSGYNGETPPPPPKPVIVPISPCLKCGVPTQTGGDSLIWSRIQIKYLRSSNELQHFLCSLHLVKEKCSVLLIDGLERFFAPDRFMGNVYQTLAYLYETLLFMQTSTGSGQVVCTGASDSFILQQSGSRTALRRWCSFVEIRDDGAGEFVLREELESRDELDADYMEKDDDDESKDGDAAKRAKRIQLRYEYCPPDARREGVFRLLHVEGEQQ